ncbi:uncharacterized protein LOC136041953 [Artemia franciscana]|uniref:uncharacterized protein LOC136041953 n=1 Tax=Artemia franciscana TaxID=6661 RepID=UPI0032DB0B69
MNNWNQSKSNNRETHNRWKEYIHGTLNFALPADPPDGRPLFQLDISTEAISIYNIETVLRKLKNGKAADIDRTHPELLKYGVGVLPEPLHEVLMQIWDTEDIPTDWKKGYILKLIKKGRVADYDNWRGITLQSAGSEVLSQVLWKHIKTKVEAIFKDEQHGFQPSRSCAYIIFILRIFIEDSNKWQTEIIMAFMEFQKTFDSVHRDSLRNVLRYYGFPDKMVRIKMALNDKQMCAIQTNDKDLTEWFKVNSNGRQGCIRSSVLFILLIGFIKRTCNFISGWHCFHVIALKP